MVGPGALVGSYRILEPLGQGGMGVVFLAEHVALGRRVALKVLKSEGSDAETVSRFFNEARAVNRIAHEHIVEVTDFGTTPGGDPFFVMERLVGESLAARLRLRGRLGLEEALHVALQVADALGASHALGIVHRDLKPANVFLIERGGDRDYVKLLDFGIAKLVGASGLAANHETRSGTLLGTPHYMSPEQGKGHADLNHRTDVYALGVMIFEMVTGRVPFTAEGWGEILIKHATEPFPPARAEVAELPAALDDVLARAVAKERQARFATMAEFRAVLCELGEDNPEPRRPASARRGSVARRVALWSGAAVVAGAMAVGLAVARVGTPAVARVGTPAAVGMGTPAPASSPAPAANAAPSIAIDVIPAQAAPAEAALPSEPEAVAVPAAPVGSRAAKSRGRRVERRATKARPPSDDEVLEPN